MFLKINETPLHFACKFGSEKVARILISFKMCNQSALNKYGKTPREIICTKAIKQEAKNSLEAITSLFEGYIHLYYHDGFPSFFS